MPKRRGSDVPSLVSKRGKPARDKPHKPWFDEDGFPGSEEQSHMFLVNTISAAYMRHTKDLHEQGYFFWSRIITVMLRTAYSVQCVVRYRSKQVRALTKLASADAIRRKLL